ncbi:MAG: universal stress protein [Betaproteobacteria bacterium]|nr:universal stress protein [Betaproteobacteria bacterium]MDH5221838.1 universal stress protein [Betaproteobacteria bacterium]MDH5350113.1 universal stress protein [Betaproteobacteria bacterium]
MNEEKLKLVLAYDGSPASRRATELIAGYRGAPGVLEVAVVNVQTRPPALWPGAGLDPAALDAALAQAGKSELAPALERLAQAGIAAHGEVRFGLPAQALLDDARALGAQAIVMGTRGRGAVHGFAFGSAAMRVAHGGVAPALIVGPECALPRALGERLRVLCAVDGSEPALRAVERLLAWRAWLGELEVQLAHVQAPLTLLEKMLPPHEDALAQWRGDEGARATQAARAMLEGAGVAHELHLLSGEPAGELLRLARSAQCELLVLGTRGRGAAHHALVGSVALKAAASSPVPSLLVA